MWAQALADVASEPPRDLALWVGGIVLASGATGLVTRALSRGEKESAERRAEDAKWRAEVQSDLKRLLDNQAAQATNLALLAKDITQLGARVDHLEHRQDEQARAHREAMAAQAASHRDALAALESRLRGGS